MIIVYVYIVKYIKYCVYCVSLFLFVLYISSSLARKMVTVHKISLNLYFTTIYLNVVFIIYVYLLIYCILQEYGIWFPPLLFNLTLVCWIQYNNSFSKEIIRNCNYISIDNSMLYFVMRKKKFQFLSALSWWRRVITSLLTR